MLSHQRGQPVGAVVSAVRLVADSEQAGAAACVLNHSGDIGRLVEFVAEVRRRGCTLPVLAPVPMVSDARHATALTARYVTTALANWQAPA